jgi:photosynthetic reaction center cytochrome c subunit
MLVDSEHSNIEANLVNKNLILTCCIALFLAFCGVIIGGTKVHAAPQSQASAAARRDSEKKAEEQFKNIQVLKGIPADQIIPTMQFITASLGVECEYCHVQGAFDKDDKKPKQVARKMIEMMFAINADNFDRHREVTCYSCHRGGKDPVSMPPVATEDALNAGPAHGSDHTNPSSKDAASPDQEKEASGPAPDQLLDKYLQAVGGAAAVDKISSRVMKGTIDVGGHSLPIDIYAKEGKRISFAHLPGGDSITAFNGHEGWLASPGHALREMHAGDLDGASFDADLHLPIDLKKMFSQMQRRGTETIGDEQTYVVVGQRDAKPPVRLYFDEQTGLLARLVRFDETALGRLPTQIDYADYREANGVKIPYRWTLARPGGRFTIQVSELQQNVPVDDAKFVKPPAPPEPPKHPAN